ncbi:MAG: hypothetical protein JSU87_13185 [Gemmatimonadota bacterium]|nr:MAG: hypothetical protein JSU87_13185 [Gemmatimonadota bacterium]
MNPAKHGAGGATPEAEATDGRVIGQHETAGSAPTEDLKRALPRLAVLVVAALLVRGLFFWLRGDYLDWDEAMYLLIARSYLEGAGPSLNGLPHTALGPLLPAATAALSLIGGLSLLAAQRALSVLSGALLIIPVWYLLRRSSAGADVAWTATSLLVAWPALVDVSPKLGPIWQHMYAGTEPTYLLLLFAAVGSGEAALRGSGPARVVLSLLGGAILALAYMTRAEAIVFAGLYVLMRGVVWFREGNDWRGLLVPALAGVGYLVIATPQLIRLHEVHDRWSLSGQPSVMRPAAETLQESFRDDRHLINFVKTWYRLDSGHTHLLNPYWGTPSGVAPEQQRSQFARLAALEAPTSRSWSARIANRLENYLYMLWTLCGPLFVIFVVLGLFVSRGLAQPAFVAAGLAASLVVGLYLAVLPRFFLYLVPALALWAGHGIEKIAVRFRRRRPLARRIMVGALVALSLLSVGRNALGDLAQRLSVVAYEDRKVGEDLAPLMSGDSLFMHWHPRFAVWGGWEWRTMPMASLDGMAHYASRVGTRHILLARGGYSPLRPGVPYLLLIIDEELQEALRALSSGGGGERSHPPIVLTPIDPVAGYPTGVLSLGDPPE